MRRIRLLKRTQRSYLFFSVFIIAFTVIGGYKLFFSHAATTQANLWVDTNGGTCTRQATAGAYVDAQACSSVANAYNAAVGGDTIDIKAGSYGGLDVNQRSLGASYVTIQKEPGGGAVTATSMSIASSYVIVDGINSLGTDGQAGSNGITIGQYSDCPYAYPNANWPCQNPYNHIIVRNFSTNNMYISADYVTLQYGNIGPYDGCYGVAHGNTEDGVVLGGQGSAASPQSSPDKYFTMDHVNVHDITWTGCGAHVDAIQGYGFQHWVYTNDNFWNDSTYTIAYSQNNSNPHDIEAFTIENSTFGGSNDEGQPVSLGPAGGFVCGTGDYHQYVFQNNTFYGGDTVNLRCDQSAYSGVFRNNIVNGMACGNDSAAKNFDYAYNVWGANTDTTCRSKPNSKTCVPTYADPAHANQNVDLSPSDTCAKDYIPATSGTFPATDIHGTTRPQGTNVDAGADEVVNTGPPTANLWVDTNGGSCTRQATPGVYVDAQACASYTAAYNAASSGDTIKIKNGTYASQTIPQGTKTLSFIGESKNSVQFPSLTVDGSNVTVDGFSANTTNNVRSLDIVGTSITVTNFNALSVGIGDTSAGPRLDNDTLSHGNVGPSNACNGPEDGIQAYGNSGTWGAAPINGLHINDVTIHDLSGIECNHEDGIQGAGALNWLIENSHFYYTSSDYMLIIGHLQNITVQNNFFGTVPDIGNSIVLQNDGSGCSNTLIQNNTFYAGSTSFAGMWNGCNPSVVRNNYFHSGVGPCGVTPTALTIDYNVFQSAGDACGTHTKICTATWAAGVAPNDANPDIAANDTCVKDFIPVSPVTYPSYDIHGNPRPGGTAVDAGANEVDSGGGGGGGDSTPPTVSMTAPSSGATISGTNVTLSATASDNVGVSGVQFKLDGNGIGSQDTTSPYSISWDSSFTSNGSHSLTATAYDTSGNSTTSSAITVTVSNSTIHLGEANILSTSDTGNANMLLAQSATLSQTATIQSLSFYVNNPAGKLRLGIYDATGPGGGPGTLKAQTAEITPISGWNTANVTNQVSLSAGNYWLAYLPSDNNLSFVKTADASSSGKFYSFTYGALPSTFSTSPSSTTSHWSLYATLSTNTGGGPVPGDCNANSHVDITDLSTLLSHFNQNYSQCDFNSDSVVNIIDLSILLSHFGT